MSAPSAIEQATSDQAAIQITIYTYDKTQFIKKIISDPSLLTEIQQGPLTTWIDINGTCSPTILEQIFTALNIPASDILLSLSNTTAPYFTYSLAQLFQFSRIVYYDADLSPCDTSFLLGKNFLLSFHSKPIKFLEKIAAELNNPECALRAASIDYLLYGHLAHLIDTHLEKLHQLGSQVDAIEGFLVTDPQNFSMDTFFTLRKAFVVFRRTLWLHRDLYNQALALGSTAPPQLLSGLNSLAAKASDLLDLCDNYVDHCHALLDIYYSSISTQMNRVMKTLTIFSVIFLPLSFLAGLWGMNFHNPNSPWSMPELKMYYGYPMAIIIMLVIAVTLLTVFIHIGWLKIGKK